MLPIQFMNDAIKNRDYIRLYELLKNIDLEKSETEIKKLNIADNPLHTAVTHNSPEAILLLVHFGFSVEDLTISEEETYLEHKMRFTKTWKQGGRIAVLLAALGAEFGDEEQSLTAKYYYPKKQLSYSRKWCMTN